MTYTEIIDQLKNEVLETYPPNGINIVIPTQSNYSFQLTSTANELKTLNNSQLNNNAMSIINLKGCENLLKAIYNIPKEYSLIILKFENSANIASEKNIQYEIYNPITFEKLNLSICAKNDIDIVIPIKLDKEIKNLYDLIKDQGYDLFDENSNFYTDFCTPFTAENGADVLLDDRKLYFYSKIANIKTCPKNCEYSNFYIETESISCKCKVNNDEINVGKTDIFSLYKKYSPELNGMKYSSYKTMKCYKLVFDIKNISKNPGSIIASVIVILFIIFMICSMIKGISPLKLLISKNLFEEKKDDIFSNLNPIKMLNKNNKTPKKRKCKSKSVKKSMKGKFQNNMIKDSMKDLLYPPKKSKVNKVIKNKSPENKKETEKLKLTNLLDKNKAKRKTVKVQKNKSIKKTEQDKTKKSLFSKKKQKTEFKSVKYDKNPIRKSIIDLSKEREIRIKKEKEKIVHRLTEGGGLIKKNILNKDKDKEQILKNKKMVNIKDNKELDDYELNHLAYKKVLLKDKRDCCQIYWSIIKRDELFLFTFVSCNDYNLFYIKIEKFFLVILTLMAMNAFLFADEKIHKYFIEEFKYNFIKHILQIVLSIIITHIFEIFLCFFTLTDRYYYLIKAITKPETAGKKIFGILKGIKIRLVIFFIFMFLLELFYWYFISAFCAVYKNTVVNFIIDSLISFIIFLVDPFFVYALIALIRIIGLKCKVKCLFNLGRIFPIF